jgi:secondary thiamine-phosphate synthase enzyme
MIKEFSVSTKGKQELVDITHQVEKIVKESGIKNGICTVYVPHATAAITINENADPNIKDDILSALNKMVEEHGGWKHDRIDNNAAGHIRSSIVGCSEIIPIKDNELTLGTWQDIFLCDFDGPRNRRVIVNIQGD